MNTFGQNIQQNLLQAQKEHQEAFMKNEIMTQLNSVKYDIISNMKEIINTEVKNQIDYCLSPEFNASFEERIIKHITDNIKTISAEFRESESIKTNSAVKRPKAAKPLPELADIFAKYPNTESLLNIRNKPSASMKLHTKISVFDMVKGTVKDLKANNSENVYLIEFILYPGKEMLITLGRSIEIGLSIIQDFCNSRKINIMTVTAFPAFVQEQSIYRSNDEEHIGIGDPVDVTGLIISD